jgi:FkbM family methyltransferase
MLPNETRPNSRVRHVASRAASMAHNSMQVRRQFSNWAEVLSQIALRPTPLRHDELTFRSRTGVSLSCANHPNSFYPVLEVLGRDIYRCDDFTTLNVSSPRIVDVGAHIGSFAIKFGDHFPSCEIWAYEPAPSTYRFLIRNVERNGMAHRVHAFEQAVAGRSGRGELYENTDGSCLSSLVPVEGWPAHTVDLISMEQVIKSVGSTVDLAKIDCEGGEYEIFEATPGEAWEPVRAIVLEFHPVRGRSFSEVESRLATFGFELCWVRDQFEPGLGTAHFVRR